MTVIYQYKVANTGLGTFVKLLARWRGSVYKLLYKEMIIYSSLYMAISLTYRLALDSQQRLMFEKVVISCHQYTSYIPLSFVLGFYVSMVVSRWWKQFENFPWPDRTIFLLCCYLPGQTDRKRLFRRTVARYMMFGIILIARSISVAVMKRFPTLDHIVEAGFITKEEAAMYEDIDCKYNKFWVPFMWVNTVLVTARKEGLIQTDFGLRMVIEPVANIRDTCSKCFVFDWITIPLVYTQVVTWAVHTYFGTTLVSQQYLDPSKNYTGYETDFYVPIFTLLQFFFYMGWLKVAEQLINPFGEDDDDFDINWLIDRHAAVVMALVDQMCDQCPPLVKDIHFDDSFADLPYTEASLASKKPMFLGSTYNLATPTSKGQRMVIFDTGDIETQRHTSIGSSHYNGGSMASMVTGRTSKPRFYTNSQDHLFNIPSEHQLPNGHNPEVISNMDEEIDLRNKTRLRPPSLSKRPSWSSDSSLTKRTLARVVSMGRDRANTDSRGKSRKRKISFPLHLTNFFRRNDSRKSSSDSTATVRSAASVPRKISTVSAKELERDFEYAQEYVPLKRASLERDEFPHTNTTKHNERRRKISFPPNLVDPGENRTADKSSRFTVERVSDGSEVDFNSLHKRNAQKIEKGISDYSVSRAPLLSAIEEGGTITSISQLEETGRKITPTTPTIEEEEIFGDSHDELETAPMICVNGEEETVPMIQVNGEDVDY